MSESKKLSSITMYQRRNPDKLERWRYNAALNLVNRYEAAHPEVVRERQIRERVAAEMEQGGE